MPRQGRGSLKASKKKHENQAQEEKKLSEAANFLQKSGIRHTTSNTYYGLPVTSVAAQFGVNYQTLRRRLEGVENRCKSQKKMMKLTPEQETVLEAWIISLGHRSIPWTPQLVREKASVIADCYIGNHWVYGFLARHPRVKVRKPAELDTCRARAVNQTTTASFFDLLKSTVNLYNIGPENTYNMDEKGVQMGLGAHTRVLVDRTQKTIYMKTDGNRELVTLVECVCADGTALSPLAIFKGKRTNAKWAQATNINANIACSPNGWTDAELGSLWLDLIFEPQTRLRLADSSEYRLLILDGHCSHCTLKFLGLAEKYKIIIICLPPHTTHVLQPCDVGVFGPLSTRYKKEVTELSKLNVPIRKDNLLEVYGKARSAAFSASTIKSAFRKTGIHPLNPSILPVEVFAPALTTTTQSAQPVPTAAPTFINAIILETPSGDDNEVHEEPAPALVEHIEGDEVCPMESEATLIMQETNTAPDASEPVDTNQSSLNPQRQFQLILPDIPSVLPPRASRMELLTHIGHLRKLIEEASSQIAADHAQKILMDQENGQLRMQLFHKSKEKEGSRVLTSSARLLTHQETQILFQVYTYSERMKAVHEEIPLAASACARRIEDKRKEKERTEISARRQKDQQQKETERQRKATEKEAIRQQKEIEREVKKVQKAAEKAAEKEKKAAEKEQKARERLEQLTRMKNGQSGGSQHRFADSPLSSATILRFNKENTHLPTAVSQQLTVPQPTVSTLQPMAQSSRPPLSNKSLNGDGKKRVYELEMAKSSRFDIHLVDPELLGANV